MSKDTGGAAFPMLGNIGYNTEWQTDQGMSLRDYLAAKCCAAMVSTIRNDGDYLRLRAIASGHDLESVSQFFAQEAYKQADAMIAVRNA